MVKARADFYTQSMSLWIAARRRVLASLRVATAPAAWIAFACLPFGPMRGQGVAGTAEASSYYEFGTVAGVGQGSIDVLSTDPVSHHPVRHRFQLTRESRADVVRPGDAVEVIFSVSGSEWRLHRLLMLNAGLPKAGPPPPAGAAGGRTLPSTANSTLAEPAARPAASARNSAPPASSPASALKTRRGTGRAAAIMTPGSATSPVAEGKPATRTATPAQPVDLSNHSVAKTPPVTYVPLGIAAGYSTAAKVPVTKAVTRDTPSEACNRSVADWPDQPIHLAVLDFRYPTEREEAHDIGKTGGGSGTAVADLVFTRLENLHEFALVRGDRRRLDRSDIAGAARLGRELGVDAVLEGTFAPLEAPVGPDGLPTGPKKYELHAGLVDTCTGQVLMKLSSASCAAGIGNAGGNGAGSCPGYTVTAREAEDPDEHAQAFTEAIGTMLSPLEHNRTPEGLRGASGEVVSADGGRVVVRLAAGARVTAGDQLAIHAVRLAKNPQTYTLQSLRDQEIGRLMLTQVSGSTAAGTYAGDVPAQRGDAVETVP